MVNKDIVREIFMKLESYDRINVISDILKLSNMLELEFYSSLIESILQYHKLSFNSISEDLNDSDNIKHLIDSDCMKSDVRTKLISTLSLLKSSNISGANHIFEFLKQNHIKFKEQANNNPEAFEEIMLIYQLANDHPAFSFDHCQEIYDYLTQIRSLYVPREYFTSNNNYQFINDLSVLSINVNDHNQYVYMIKVQWDNCECCITRTLEEIYHFYRRVCTMFPDESKNGEICKFFINFLPDDLDLSFNLMSTFFKDFLNSPQLILRCDFVRQFFKPQLSDRDICSCETCPEAFDKFHWGEQGTFNTVASDNDEYPQSSDIKTNTSCSSNFNFSIDSKCHSDNIPLEGLLTNRSYSGDGSESYVKRRGKKTKIYSTGSSPIHTPSDESEYYSKNESLRNPCNRFSRQLSMVTENVNKKTTYCIDRRTENWLSQSNQTITDNQSEDLDDIDKKSVNSSRERLPDSQSDSNNTEFDISSIAHCQIGNLYDWLRDIGLQKYYSNLYQIKFEHFYFLTEKRLIDLGLDDNGSRTMVTMIGGIKRSDIVQVNQGTVNLLRREGSHLNKCSSSSIELPENQFPVDLSKLNYLGIQNQEPRIVFTNLGYRYWIPNNCIIFASNTVQNVLVNLPMRPELNHPIKKQSDQH